MTLDKKSRALWDSPLVEDTCVLAISHDSTFSEDPGEAAALNCLSLQLEKLRNSST